MASNSHNEIIKCLKQELTDSMIPALTRIDMEMMKLHHKLEAVLTKIDKHESQQDSRFEEYIAEVKEMKAKMFEHVAQLKKDIPLFFPSYPPPPLPRVPPLGPRFAPATGFRLPSPYDYFGCRSPAEIAVLQRSPLTYYQQRKEFADKGKRMANKGREPATAYGEGIICPTVNRQYCRTQTVLPQSTGHRSSNSVPPLSPSKAGSSQQWTRRGAGVFTSDEDSDENNSEQHRSDAGAHMDEDVVNSYSEINSVTAFMKSVEITKRNDTNNNAASKTTDDDSLLWDDSSWGLNVEKGDSWQATASSLNLTFTSSQLSAEQDNAKPVSLPNIVPTSSANQVQNMSVMVNTERKVEKEQRPKRVHRGKKALREHKHV